MKRRERITLSAVREAFFRGDFEGCLALCDAFEPRDARDAAEIVLLRARSLIPLGRGEHAIQALRGLRIADEQHDEFLIGRTLMSAAYMSLSQNERGLEIAREAYDALGDAHATVRAELMVNLAVAYYRNGEIARAQRCVDSVPADTDIVYARALEYRGWLAWARGDYAGSVDQFCNALRHLDTCQHHDRFIEAKCLYGVTFLCGELPRLDLWPEIAERIERFDWSVSGVAVWRFWISIAGSYIAELRGDSTGATSWVASAEENAPDPACLIIAWCRLAARFGRNGETGAHRYFTEKARRKYDEIARDPRLRDQRSLSLDIAEEIVHTSTPAAAMPLLTYFSEVVLPTMSRHGDDRRIIAAHAMTTGLFEERRGNRARAEKAYLEAFETYRSGGLLRRAAIAAYRLSVLTGEDRHAAFIADVLRDASESYWVKARIAKSRVEAHLTKRQWEVLQLIAEGRSNKEIAAACRISYYTARNTVANIFAKLGVESRVELAGIAAALRTIGSGN
jgi:DNA-binding CsgD family transcriptional regulator